MAITKTKSLNSNTPVHIYTGTFDLASVAAASAAAQDVTVTGVGASDVALAFYCTDASFGLGVGNVRVKAADTLEVTLVNPTAGAIDRAGTFNYIDIVAAG